MGKRIKDLSRAETYGYLAVDNATNGTGKMHTDTIFKPLEESGNAAIKYESIRESMVYGYAVKTNDPVGTTISLEPYSLSSCAYGIFDCKKGESFIIKASGLSNARLWCFVDADYAIVSQAPASVEYSTETKIFAPSDGKLIVNFFGNQTAQLNNVLKSGVYAIDLAENAIGPDTPFEEILVELVGGYYTFPAVGQTLLPTAYTPYSSARCGYIKAKQGDKLKVKGHSSSGNITLYAFLNNSFEIVEKAASSYYAPDYIYITAPSDGYFYVNDWANSVGEFGAYLAMTIGHTIDYKISEISYDVINLSADVTAPMEISKNTIINGNGHSFDLSTDLSPAFNVGIAEVAYTAAASSNVYKVFVGQTLPLVNEGTRPYNNVTIWAVDSELGNCVNLTPKLTQTEVENNDNSFTYDGDGTKFIIHCEQNDGKKFILLPDAGTCLYAHDCDVKIFDCKFIGAANMCLRLERCNYEIRNCEFAFSKIESTCSIRYSNGNIYNSIAHHSNVDGYGINHGYNNQLIGCSACYCDDDGVSHHGDTNRTKFIVDGGEWHHNFKGGIASPVYGSWGEIKNAYLHDNLHGIYCDAADDAPAVPLKVIVSSCVFENNTTALRARDYNFVLINCVFSGNTEKFSLAGSATKKEFNSVTI